MLNRTAETKIYGKIMDNLDSFDQMDDNSFILSSGRVALKSLLQTQNEISFNFNLITGDSLKLIVRTADYMYDNKKGITFTIGKKSLKIYENGLLKQINANFQVLNGNKYFCNIRSVGDVIHFKLNCDEISINTKIPCSEYLLISAPENSDVKITAYTTKNILENQSINNFKK